VLNASPLAAAQFASAELSGVTARAAGELGEAPAGLISTDAPVDEKKKRRLIVNALMDFLIDIFVVFSSLRQLANY
jgi:hypothetical protein